MNGSFDIYLAERIGPPAGAQLTVEGTGGSNSAYIIANNTLAGAQKFVDEGANTSQVPINSCGAFPSIIGPPDNPAGKADNNLKIEQPKTKLYALKNVIPIKKEGEKWVGKIPEKVNK